MRERESCNTMKLQFHQEGRKPNVWVSQHFVVFIATKVVWNNLNNWHPYNIIVCPTKLLFFFFFFFFYLWAGGNCTLNFVVRSELWEVPISVFLTENTSRSIKCKEQWRNSLVWKWLTKLSCGCFVYTKALLVSYYEEEGGVVGEWD